MLVRPVSSFPIPATTALTLAQVSHVQAHLPFWAVPGPSGISNLIQWRPAGVQMPGIAHGKPLFKDPETGSVALPIWMAPCAIYSEHIHVGLNNDGALFGEDVIFLEEGARALVDLRGRYTTESEYRQGRWSIHTPAAEGEAPVIFIGIAHGGVIMTGLDETEGADLLRAAQLGPEFLDRYFHGVPPDRPEVATRAPLANFLFGSLQIWKRDLRFRGVSPTTYTRMMALEARTRFEPMFALSPPDRVSRALADRTMAGVGIVESS